MCAWEGRSPTWVQGRVLRTYLSISVEFLSLRGLLADANILCIVVAAVCTLIVSSSVLPNPGGLLQLTSCACNFFYSRPVLQDEAIFIPSDYLGITAAGVPGKVLL